MMKKITFILTMIFSLVLTKTFAQGSCATAVPLTPGTQQCGDTSSGADVYDDNTCLGNFDFGDDYIFSYVATATGETLTLDLTGVAGWTGFAMSDDCPDVPHNCLGSATSPTAGNINFTSSPLTSGVTYYIHISTWPPPQSTAFCLDAVVNPAPTCLDPNTFVASNITLSSVDLSWNDPSGTQSDFEYVIQPQGTGMPTGAGTPISGLTVTDNTLSAATVYEAWVRADCGGGDFSGWVGPVVFTTSCVIFTAPYAEDFENAGTIPPCWSMSGSENWIFSNTGAGNHIGNNGTITGSTSSGGYFAWVDDSVPVTSDATLTSPPIDVSSLTSPTLFFYELSDNESNIEGANPNSTLNVEVWDGAAWNAIATFNTNTNGWTERIINLSSLTITGDISVRFIIVESTSFHDDIAIDDVRIDEAPACFNPINLGVANITANTVDVLFTDASGGNQFDFAYVVQPQGTGAPATYPAGTLEDGSNQINATDFSIPVSGLNSNTDYEIYVAADCNGNWVGPFNFTTLCDVFTVPSLEDFTTYVPGCWEEADNGDLVAGPATFGASSWIADGFGNVGTTGSARIEIWLATLNDWIISPTYTIPTAGYELKFDAATTEWSSTAPPTVPWEADDVVEVLISTTGTTNWTVLYTYNDTNVPSTTGTPNIIDLDAYAGQNVRFAFRALEGTANGSADLNFYVDNFEIRQTPITPPACATNVVGTPDASCGNFDNVLTWDAVSGADGYYLTIGTTSGGNDILDNQDVGAVVTYTFAGAANTTYYFTVTPYNSNGPATGCTEVSFTTAATGCYCTSVPTSNDGNGISNVQIATTDFPTGDVTYFDHTATVVDLAQGINSNVQVTFETGFTYDTNIWIDFNDDYTFDSSELVFQGVSLATNPTTLDASFVMPATAPLGQHRMRIGTADTGQNPPNPCYSGSWGVTLDFTINVIAATCSPAVVASSTIVPDCVNGQFSVDIDVTALGDGTPVVSDGTTTWPIAATGIVTAGPFADGASVTLTILHGSDATCDLPLGNFSNTCPAANDDLCNAIPLVVNAISTGTQYNNIGATAEVNEPVAVCFNNGIHGSVWFSFVAPASGEVIITTDIAGATLIDTEIALYDSTGVNCSDLSTLGAELACDQDGGTTVVFNSIIYQAGLTPGTTYFIQVDVWDAAANGVFGIEVQEVLSSDLFDNNNFMAYPNPVKDVLNLSYTSEITNVRVVNMLGQEVISRNLNATTAQVDMSQLSAGAYIVNVTIGDAVKTLKVVKQ